LPRRNAFVFHNIAFNEKINPPKILPLRRGQNKHKKTHSRNNDKHMDFSIHIDKHMSRVMKRIQDSTEQMTKGLKNLSNRKKRKT
jgi:hypothetical protein